MRELAQSNYATNSHSGFICISNTLLKKATTYFNNHQAELKFRPEGALPDARALPRSMSSSLLPSGNSPFTTTHTQTPPSNRLSRPVLVDRPRSPDQAGLSATPQARTANAVAAPAADHTGLVARLSLALWQQFELCSGDLKHSDVINTLAGYDRDNTTSERVSLLVTSTSLSPRLFALFMKVGKRVACLYHHQLLCLHTLWFHFIVAHDIFGLSWTEYLLLIPLGLVLTVINFSTLSERDFVFQIRDLLSLSILDKHPALQDSSDTAGVYAVLCQLARRSPSLFYEQIDALFTICLNSMSKSIMRTLGMPWEPLFSENGMVREKYQFQKQSGEAHVRLARFMLASSSCESSHPVDVFSRIIMAQVMRNAVDPVNLDIFRPLTISFASFSSQDVFAIPVSFLLSQVAPDHPSALVVYSGDGEASINEPAAQAPAHESTPTSEEPVPKKRKASRVPPAPTPKAPRKKSASRNVTPAASAPKRPGRKPAVPAQTGSAVRAMPAKRRARAPRTRR